jgi:uncharacterized membrane protein
MRLPAGARLRAFGAPPVPALPGGSAGLDRPLAVAADAGPAADGTGTREGNGGARALTTLAGMFVIAWSFRLSGYVTDSTWLAVPVAALGLAGLIIIMAAWLPGRVLTAPRQRRVNLAALLAVLVALALWSYFQVFTFPDYATDEIAFDQYAAQLALHGIDPYLRSMAPAFPLFHVSPNGYTFRLDGTPVTTLSYPALSFEAYLPVLALGYLMQAATWVNMAAWMIGSLVLFAVLPRQLAPLAVVIASTDIFTSYAAGGVTDALFVPLLVGAAVRWDRFPHERGAAAWRGPVLLGLAMAVKQTPWLLLPFLVAGIVLESRQAYGWQRARGDGLRYAGIAGAAFLLPNVPYVLAGPGAWLHGILTPLTSPTVPAGQGLIGLSLTLPLGGGSLLAYSVAAVVVLVACLACFVAYYRALKPAVFLIPSIVLFFATRSFGSYLVMLIPPAVAAAATVRAVPAGCCWRQWKRVAFAGGVASVVAIGAALAVPSPLTVSVRSVRTTGELATVEQLTVSVTNRTGGTVRPAFTIATGQNLSAFWRRRQGPAVLAAHQQAVYTIAAPSYAAMPSIAGGFQVMAFAQHPASVSRSPSILASNWRVVLEPAAVNQPVRVGQRITVRAELLNRMDQPVRIARVPVYLGQIIYAQDGPGFSQAVINHSPPGQSPVEALTNAAGVATFAIQSSVAGQDPVYFLANLVNKEFSYPYGYSEILAVKFRS